MSGSYPKWQYHADYEAVLVLSEAQAREMGEGWEDSPAKFGRDVENAPGAKRFVAAEVASDPKPKDVKKSKKREESLAVGAN